MTISLKRKPSKISYMEISEFKELPFPKENEQIRFITNKSKSTTDFIDYFIENHNILEIIIANSAIGIKSLNRIKEIIKSGIKTSIVINESETTRKPKIIEDLLEINTAKLYKLHTKIILIKTNEDCFVLEGSGNISTNAKIEQYSLVNSEESYNFHKSWIDKIPGTEEVKKQKESELLVKAISNVISKNYGKISAIKIKNEIYKEFEKIIK